MKQAEQNVETDLANAQVRAAHADFDVLIHELGTVTGCDQAAAKLISAGARAIPPLERFLLEGKPGVVYQPRRAAVEALGALGAKDVLMRYLTSERKIEDPATRFGEESVKNAAARELASFGTKDVLEALLRFALPHSRRGIVEALSQFASAEAIPYFLHALEDDLCEAAAMDGLRRLGRRAEMALVTSALTRLPSGPEERPSSLRRRAKALELIGEIGPPPVIWPLLAGLLVESDPTIVTATVKLALFLGTHDDRAEAARGLIAVLPRSDWFLREQIRTLLIDLYPEAESAVEQEAAKRHQQTEAEQIIDPTLQILESVRRRAGYPLPGIPTQ